LDHFIKLNKDANPYLLFFVLKKNSQITITKLNKLTTDQNYKQLSTKTFFDDNNYMSIENNFVSDENNYMSIENNFVNDENNYMSIESNKLDRKIEEKDKNEKSIRNFRVKRYLFEFKSL